MAGQHIEREARYAQTGLTSGERDKLILQLNAKGYSQAKIGRYLGLTQPAIHYALQRLSGTAPRKKSVRMDMCEGCWDDFPADQLNGDGLCSACQGSG